MKATWQNERLGWRRIGVLLGMVCIFTVAANIAAAGQVSWDVNGNTGTQSNLFDAVTDVNDEVVINAGSYTDTVEIKINGNQTATGKSDNSAWYLHGWDVVTPMPTPYGFYSVKIGSATSDMVTLSNSGLNATLLKILYVENDITVENMKLTGGNLELVDLTDSEVGGGGLMLGGNGLGGVVHPGPLHINLNTVDVEGNTIKITDANTTENVFGGGVYVVGAGFDGSGPQPESDVTFNNVNLRNNTLDVTVATPGGKDLSIRGGGAQISYSTKVTYDTGEVTRNKVILKGGSHASGGGLSVDGGGAYTNVDI